MVRDVERLAAWSRPGHRPAGFDDDARDAAPAQFDGGGQSDRAAARDQDLGVRWKAVGGVDDGRFGGGHQCTTPACRRAAAHCAHSAANANCRRCRAWPSVW